MAATVTEIQKFKMGNGIGAIVDITFDNSYPTNGEAVTLPLEVVREIFFEQKSGYLFEYDASAGKVKVYSPQAAVAAHSHTVALDTGVSAVDPPALVVEESVALTDGVGVLAYEPLYVIAVQATAGGTTGPCNLIPVGATGITGQVIVNFASGAIVFNAPDAVTACKVTYIPKRSSGYLSGVTVDEEVTAAAAKANLAARAGLVQYVYDTTDGVLVSLEQPGTAPSATHFCTVDINDAGNSSIDSHADDEGNTLKVTYVPFDQLPPGCFIDDDDITLNSETWNFTGDPLVSGYNNLIVPGFGTQLIGETGAAARSAAAWVGPSEVAADGVAVFNSPRNTIGTAQTVAMTVASIPWMIMDPTQLSHTHGPGSLADAASGTGGAIAAAAAAELANGSAVLDGVTVRAVIFGY